MCAENITQVSAKDKTWNMRKGENAAVGHLYGLEPRFMKYSERMSACADWLEFAEVAGDLAEHDRKLKLSRASFCHVRHCPVCQWRQSLARIARCMRNLPCYLAENPDYVYILVTLTTRNCGYDELRVEIKTQNDGVKKLLKRRELKGVVKGYVRVNEVTKGRDGLAHPHIHLILAVPKSYFGRAYVTQARWVALWGDVLGLDYAPSVDVRRVKLSERKKAKLREKLGREPNYTDEVMSGLLEVCKYSVKPDDTVNDTEFLYAVTEQCFKLRFIATGGCMKDIFKNGQKDEENISDEEMMLPGGDDGEKAGPWRRLYLWEPGRWSYRLRQRRKASEDRLMDALEFREGLTDALRARAQEERERQRKTPPRTAGDAARVSA